MKTITAYAEAFSNIDYTSTPEEIWCEFKLDKLIEQMEQAKNA